MNARILLLGLSMAALVYFAFVVAQDGGGGNGRTQGEPERVEAWAGRNGSLGLARRRSGSYPHGYIATSAADSASFAGLSSTVGCDAIHAVNRTTISAGGNAFGGQKVFRFFIVSNILFTVAFV